MGYTEDVAAAKAAVAAAQAKSDSAAQALVVAQNALTVAGQAAAVAASELTAAQAALQTLLDNPPPPPPPPVTSHALLGMSAPADMWATRVSEVGPGLQARRVFLSALGSSLTLPKAAVASKMAPVISYAVAGDLANIAAGKATSALQAVGDQLAALNYPVYVALVHEPNSKTDAATWSKANAVALPIIKSRGAKIQTCVIANGWWFNSNAQGLSDAELNAWIPASVRAVADVIAADTYQMAAGDEEPASKMANMVKWAHRVGDVKGLGVGEFNSTTATGIADACALLKSEPLFKFGCLWNTDLPPKVTHVTGARLTAFKTALANWNK